MSPLAISVDRLCPAVFVRTARNRELDRDDPQWWRKARDVTGSVPGAFAPEPLPRRTGKNPVAPQCLASSPKPTAKGVVV